MCMQLAMPLSSMKDTDAVAQNTYYSSSYAMLDLEAHYVQHMSTAVKYSQKWWYHDCYSASTKHVGHMRYCLKPMQLAYKSQHVGLVHAGLQAKQAMLYGGGAMPSNARCCTKQLFTTHKAVV